MMISVDGSFQDGGGQVLRTALAMSAITGQAFEITNIRKNRPKPGLRPQHLSCVKAIAELCNGSFEGAEISSDRVRFYPREIRGRTLSVDIGTAGSVTLLLQSLLVPVIFGENKFRVKVAGGTDVPFSPPVDYFSYVLLPHLRKFCESVELGVVRRGFFPDGGGKVELCVKPKLSLSKCGSFNGLVEALRGESLAGVCLASQGRLLQVRGSSVASADLQKGEVAERQAKAARLALAGLSVPVSIGSSYSDSLSTGSVMALWAVFSDSDEVSQMNPVILGSSCLGERGKRAEDVGREAAFQLLNEISSKAPVDRHLADQILPFLALAGGKVKVSEITPHCTTSIYAIERFLGKCFEVDAESRMISCKKGQL